MNTPLRSVVWALRLAAASLALSSVRAAAAESEMIKLNPFVVSTEANRGYYATETLSGTQLRTEVRDLANPITILTEEFMKDIGAVNYEEALEFLPSTREFKGDASDFESVTSRTGAPYTVRGFRSTSLTNNFFSSRVKSDNFNTEMITQSRGPNSLLFGLGSVGGALDATQKTGRFNTDSYAAEVRFDSEGSRRLTLDTNRILVPDKVAVRFAALATDQRTPRDLQYMRRNSAYLNLTLQPFKGAVLNFSAETGRIDELNPRPYLAYDSVTPWLSNSRSAFDKANRIDLALVATGTTAARNTARNLITGVSSGLPTNNSLVYIENAPQLGVQNWKFKSRGSEPVVNSLVQNTASLAPGFAVPGVAFPYATIVSGPSDFYDSTYRKFSGSWQQRLTQRTYLEVAGAYERKRNTDWQPIQRGDTEVYIDNNYYLPAQLASSNPDPTKPLNPYFGVAYLESASALQKSKNDTRQYRATLTHQFDLSRFAPVRGWDLGKVTLVGFHYYRSTDDFLLQQEEMTTTSLLATGNIADTQNRISRRYYLLPGAPVHFPARTPDLPGIRQAANPAIPGDIVQAVTSGFVNRLAPVHAPETTKSYAAIGQWELFSRRLVMTAGIRQDDTGSRRFNFRQDARTGLFGGEGEGFYDPEVSTSVKNSNMGVVLKVTKWLDFYANTATNTVAAGGANYTIFNTPVPSQEGKGYDLGVRTFLFGDRAIIKLNYFHNELANRISNPLRDTAVGVPLARETGFVERYLDGMTQNGFGSKVAGALRFRDYPGIGLWTDVESDATDGYELEATINPTKRLRLMVTVSYNDSALNATYAFFRPWYEQYVKPYRNDPAVTSKIAQPATNATTTIGDLMAGFDRRLNYHEAQIGGARIRGNKWLANVTGSYAFDAGPLRGVRAGGNVRWREAPTLGYPEVAGNFDVAHAFTGKDSLIADAFVSYNRRVTLLQRKLNWEVGLRVRNLLDADAPYAVTAVDNGAGAPYLLQRIYQPGRTFELTSGLKF